MLREIVAQIFFGWKGQVSWLLAAHGGVRVALGAGSGVLKILAEGASPGVSRTQLCEY